MLVQAKTLASIIRSSQDLLQEGDMVLYKGQQDVMSVGIILSMTDTLVTVVDDNGSENTISRTSISSIL